MKHVEISSTGVVVTVRSAPYPAKNPQTVKAPDAVECGWRKDGLQWIEPDDQKAARGRKRWEDAAHFIGEFTMAELAATELSTDPTIAALRLILSVWPKDVWSDDLRILAGLGQMVTLGILTEERKAAILAKA